MIPTFEDVDAAHRFLARRHSVSGHLHEQGVRAALDLARSLAASPRDEPAAVFYALSRYPRALGGLARALPAMIALNLARATGHPIHATAADLRALANRVAKVIARVWQNPRRHPSEIELVPETPLDFVDRERRDGAGLSPRNALGDDCMAFVDGHAATREALDRLDQLCKLVRQELGGSSTIC